MSDQDISGVGPLNPHDRKMYEQEYKQSADLFKRALDQYTKSDNPFQQAQFKDVMDKAMQVMQETANELLRKELVKQNEQISKDYDNFQQYPGDEDTIEKLQRDLDKAKKSLG